MQALTIAASTIQQCAEIFFLYRCTSTCLALKYCGGIFCNLSVIYMKLCEQTFSQIFKIFFAIFDHNFTKIVAPPNDENENSLVHVTGQSLREKS